ncbi:hypothetical protein BDV24DRAFT_130208 [Aspergillus arachidicola]|uniref:Uncharacterized protein n=1 Tax=Aspergillus arachidicola TaxID=656916 RepID=A0A5N6YGD8_9EURO|nr:hypothetical protein BDV24DRAFT_130208 [Aspergillus arachidicola]
MDILLHICSIRSISRSLSAHRYPSAFPFSSTSNATKSELLRIPSTYQTLRYTALTIGTCTIAFSTLLPACQACRPGPGHFYRSTWTGDLMTSPRTCVAKWSS